jgi:transketolase
MTHLNETDLVALEANAAKLRRLVVDILEDAGSGHTAGSLGMADVVAALYFNVLRHDPTNPGWEDRDRLVLSNGHIVPVLYAALALAGYFPVDEARSLRAFGSRLQGHPERLRLPGLETTSGPLGEGLAQASGMAYGLRMNTSHARVYCLMSDGEQQCGLTWEAAMFAGNNRLSNLTAVLDRNTIQIGGFTEDVMPLEPLREKYESFNWNVLEIDGHNIEMFTDAVHEAEAVLEKPTIILAHTIPGKGVPEIECDYGWHGKAPSKEEETRFLKALRTMGGKIDDE